LKEILKPTIIINKPNTAKTGKRLQIANKVLTSNEIVDTLKRKQEENSKKTNKKRK
jgi:hypothetical protein